jgi:hypothetical protein
MGQHCESVRTDCMHTIRFMVANTRRHIGSSFLASLVCVTAVIPLDVRLLRGVFVTFIM